MKQITRTHGNIAQRKRKKPSHRSRPHRPLSFTPNSQLKLNPMIQLRPTPHRFHALKSNLIPSAIKDVHRCVLERFRCLRDTMYRPHAIIVKGERLAGVRGCLEEDGVGRVDRNIVVKVVERCQDETVEFGLGREQ